MAGGHLAGHLAPIRKDLTSRADEHLFGCLLGAAAVHSTAVAQTTRCTADPSLVLRRCTLSASHRCADPESSRSPLRLATATRMRMRLEDGSRPAGYY